MQEPISSLSGLEVDVLVVGAGINGASTAQHLRAAGYSVLLVDKDDFASGTTSRSTRIMHWGIRFLAPERSPLEYLRRPGKFLDKLSRSRRVFGDYRNFRKETPEYLKPLLLQLPLYEGAPFAGWHVDMGVRLLGGRRADSPVRYRRLSGRAAQNAPVAALLREPERIRDLLSFEDCQFVWPERICIDAVLDTRRMGGIVRNYSKVTDISPFPDGGWLATIKDSDGGQEVTVRTKAIANMCGVWIDEINKIAARSSDARPKRKVISIKGVHIMARLPAQYRSAGVVGANSENETIFCLPWHDLNYFGPTETVYDGDINDVLPLEEDIGFLVEEANRLFPKLGLSRKDVLFAWAGIRPITYNPAYDKGDRAAMSEIHDLSTEGLPNVFAMTWGTINQHRAAALRMVDAIRTRLQPSGGPVELSYRAKIPLADSSSPPASASRPDVTIGMLRHMAAHESPRSLLDLLFRRANLAWGPFLSFDDLHRIADAVSPVFGWDALERDRQINAFVAYVNRYHLYAVPRQNPQPTEISKPLPSDA